MYTFLRTALAATALLTPALARLDSAVVNIEASHGGAGQDLTNVTVTIPLTALYTNKSTLAEVSTLYLIGAIGVPIDSITCTPFKKADGSGDAGLPFNTTGPSYISTNTNPIGSIVCISTHILYAPPSQPPGGPKPITNKQKSHTGSRHHTGVVKTSTLVKTTSVGGGKDPETLTSTAGASSASAATTSGPTKTAAASPSQSSGNAASGLILGSSEFFGGLALAGFGLAFAL